MKKFAALLATLFLLLFLFLFPVAVYAQLCPEGVCPTPTTGEKPTATTEVPRSTTEVPATSTEVPATSTEEKPPTETPVPTQTATVIVQTLPPGETPTPTLWTYPTRTKPSGGGGGGNKGQAEKVLPGGGGIPAFQLTQDAKSNLEQESTVEICNSWMPLATMVVLAVIVLFLFHPWNKGGL